MGLDIMHFKPVKRFGKDNSLDFLSLEDLSESPDYIARHSALIEDKDFEEYGIEKVIYFEIKGYQRKGMRKDFYSVFESDGIYFDLESVVKAFDYLEGDHINNLTELRSNFQENFIDNFVAGESILCISW